MEIKTVAHLIPDQTTLAHFIYVHQFMFKTISNFCALAFIHQEQRVGHNKGATNAHFALFFEQMGSTIISGILVLTASSMCSLVSMFLSHGESWCSGVLVPWHF